MPNTRITKENLKNHLHYGKWIYVLIAVVAWFAVDLVYQMTEYRPDRYHKVDVQLVGNSVFGDEGLNAVAEKALEAVKPQDARLEEVNILSIAYSGDASADVYGAQKYTVMLAANEGSVWFINRMLLENMVAQGGALPLDGYIESGALPKALAVTLPEADEDGNPTGASHVYAVDVSGLGLMLSDDIGYDSRDKVAVIFGACVNPDTAVAVLNSLIAQLTGPAPESAFARDIAAAQAEAAAEAALATEAPADGAAPTEAQQATAAPTFVPQATAAPEEASQATAAPEGT
jgi:hypothetical protein